MIVGKRYRVPTVRLKEPSLHYPAGAVVPVLGPLHEDKAIVGFAHEHWHIDFRFVDDRTWKKWDDGYRGYANVLAKVLVARLVEGGRGAVVTRLLKCRRPMPTFPTEYIPRLAGDDRTSLVPWIPDLEAAYAGQRIKPSCAVCPHRGLPLDGVPAHDGVIVCPGHGLAWDAKTGELVRRAAGGAA